MKTLTPTEIENLLHQGAQHRGWSVEKEREYVAEFAEKSGTSFEQTLWLRSCLDKDHEKLTSLFADAEELAAQMGCTVQQLMEAYIRINAETKPEKTQKH